jgi:hypothetical protein
MTTLVFPSVPYENQQVSFAGSIWIWDGVVWNLLNDGTTGGGGTSLEVSDLPPATPDPGSLWFNSLDGNLYVYYEDDDSGQWIQPALPFPTACAVLARLPVSRIIKEAGNLWVDRCNVV